MLCMLSNTPECVAIEISRAFDLGCPKSGHQRPEARGMASSLTPNNFERRYSCRTMRFSSFIHDSINIIITIERVTESVHHEIKENAITC